MSYKVPSAHIGGITVFFHAEKQFSVEVLCLHGTNFVIFYLASGSQWWYIVGYYLAPDDASTIEDVVAAVSKQPRGVALLVAGNFNTDLAAPEGHVQGEKSRQPCPRRVLRT